MSTITALLPAIFRILGLSKATPWVLMILPYIAKYLPVVTAFLENAKSTWEGFKKDYPWLASIIEKIASKLFPNLSTPAAAMITLKGLFVPHAMDAAEEGIWNRRSDGTGVTNKDLGDFPREPMN